MSYEIKQGNIFGRVGQGLAEGAGLQLPKEIERNRMNEGLRSFEKDASGLNPLQQMSRLASIPGALDHPQLIQSMAELAKISNQRRAYGQGQNPAPGAQGQQPGQPPAASPLSAIQFGQQPGQPQRQPMGEEQVVPQYASRAAQAVANPPAAAENPLSQKFVPPPAFSRDMYDRAINDAFDSGKAQNLNEAMAYADQQKQFYDAAPEAERAKLNYQKGIDNETDDLFDKDLQQLLQKQGNETFNDIPGELQFDLKKKAKNDVATGKRTPAQAAEFYSKAALDLAKTNSRMSELANRDVWDRLSPSKKEDALKELGTMSDTYSRLGASEFFYNKLRDKNLNEDGSQKGFGLSPGAAALIAFPRSAGVQKAFNETKFNMGTNKDQQSKAFAEKILHNMDSNDSILAIAKEARDKFPHSFDERAFFDYIRDHPELWRYNPRLEGEVQTGVSDLLPDWRDIGLFPSFGLSPAHNRVRK